MQDRTSANSMKVLLQRAAGPYMGSKAVRLRMSTCFSVLPLKANVRSARLMSRCPQARKHPFADCELPGRVELLPTRTMCVETVCR
jgi:hypothetical protein